MGHLLDRWRAVHPEGPEGISGYCCSSHPCGRPDGREAPGRAEHFLASGVLWGAELPGEPAAPWSPRTGRGPEDFSAC